MLVSCRGVLSVPGCLARLADGALWACSSLQNMCRAAAAASLALPRLQSSSHRSVLSAVPANIRGLSCASEWSRSAAGASSLVWHDSKSNAPSASRLSWLCMNLLRHLLLASICSRFRSLDFAAYLSHAHLRLDRLSASVLHLRYVCRLTDAPCRNHGTLCQAFHQSSQCLLVMYHCFFQHAGLLCCKFA